MQALKANSSVTGPTMTSLHHCRAFVDTSNQQQTHSYTGHVMHQMHRDIRFASAGIAMAHVSMKFHQMSADFALVR